jgi:TRAP-type C4-dicarboxylate transport system permease small subunit
MLKDVDDALEQQTSATVHHTTKTMPRWLSRVDFALGVIVSVPAALLVLAEIVLLFSGVVARYVLHHPLIWSDELAAILFLWLAMTGAATALHRGSHMRMTALVNRMGEHWDPFWDTISMVASMLFLGLILVPSIAYIKQQWDILTPTMEINDGLRVAAIIFGIVSMLLICVVKLLAIGWKTALAGIVVSLERVRYFMLDLVSWRYEKSKPQRLPD